MKKNIITGGVILLVVLAGFLGYTYMGKQGAVDGPRLVDSTQPLTSGGEIDTSDWKVYENDDLGVRFMYPDNFRIAGENREIQGIDRGKRLLVAFESLKASQNFYVSIFSDDFSEGVSEGMPTYFDSFADPKELENFFSKHMKIRSSKVFDVNGKHIFSFIGSTEHISEKQNAVYITSKISDQKILKNVMLSFSGDSVDEANAEIITRGVLASLVR